MNLCLSVTATNLTRVPSFLMPRVRKSKMFQIGRKSSYKTNFDMRNWLEMVSELSDFSLLIIGSLDEKESENRKCSKLVENHSINQFRHEKSIGNNFRIIRLLYLDHRFPWWKRVRKSKMLQIGLKSSYKQILTWEIDWKWF